MAEAHPKNPIFVESGREGARRRWGPQQRIVRLDSLSNEERALVVALVRHMSPKTSADDSGPKVA